MPLATKLIRVCFLFSCFSVSQELASGEESSTTPAQTSIASLPLSAYVGQYQAGESFGKFIFAVRIVDGKLAVESVTLPSTPLEPKSGDRFAIAGGPEFDFERGTDGKIVNLTVAADDGKPEHALKLAHISSQDTVLNHNRAYVSSEAMIPMRDGVKLHTILLRPKDSLPGEQGIPFLMERTPYGVQGRSPAYLFASKPDLAESGYIFVFQDIRGRYGSEGSFEMNHPVVAHTSSTDVDEITDTRDSIDWLLKNEPGNSGTVGVFGISYPGFLAIMAAIQVHPAVKAVSPQAPMTDAWIGDDFSIMAPFARPMALTTCSSLRRKRQTSPRARVRTSTSSFLST